MIRLSGARQAPYSLAWQYKCLNRRLANQTGITVQKNSQVSGGRHIESDAEAGSIRTWYVEQVRFGPPVR